MEKLIIENISHCNLNNINFKNNYSKADFNYSTNPNYSSENLPDSFETLSNKNISIEAKQNIIHNSKLKTLDYVTLFLGPFAPIRYILKPNSSYAKEYNLDLKKDEDFIKKIKKEQIKTTLPLALASTAFLCLTAIDMQTI